MNSQLKQRERQKLERRRRILATARRLFLDSGYGKTTMSSIAVRLGGSKSTLWSYFPSKAELFAAVVSEASSSFRDELSAGFDPTGALEERLTDICRRFLTRLSSPESLQLQRLVIAETAHQPEIGELFHTHAVMPGRDLIASFLVADIDQGRIHALDPQEAAQTLLNLCLGTIHRMLMRGGPPPTRAEIQIEAKLAAAFFAQLFVKRPESDADPQCGFPEAPA